MIIQCENCKRKYRLDDSRINPPGSSVKCSKCGHTFFASKTEYSHQEDKSVVSKETPLFEELKEESTEEITAAEEKGAESHEEQGAIFETPSNLAQGQLSVADDIVDGSLETDNDIIDIPTEHQTDLEDYIDQDITENAKTDIQSEDSSIHENEELKDDLEIPTIEEDSEIIENPPELFESEETLDNQLGDNELNEELYSDKSFEEESHDEEPTDNTENLSKDEQSLEQETQIIEQAEQEDLEETNKDITQKTPRGKIIKSNTNNLTRFIYTLITIAALFIIFITSFIILIKAEILPKGSSPSLTSFVESIIPLELNEDKTPQIIISEHKARWMNTVNGPVYIVSGLVTNESQTPVHYIKLRSEYIVAGKKVFEDTFYAGNTFTDVQLKVSPIQNILSKLDQKNGDIDIENSKKLAGLNYNIQPGESIPFFTVFPADGRVLGLKYKLEVINYKEEPSD